MLGSFLTVTGITIVAPESTPWTVILAVVVAVIDFAITLIDLPVKEETKTEEKKDAPVVQKKPETKTSDKK